MPDTNTYRVNITAHNARSGVELYEFKMANIRATDKERAAAIAVARAYADHIKETIRRNEIAVQFGRPSTDTAGVEFRAVSVRKFARDQRRGPAPHRRPRPPCRGRFVSAERLDVR